MEIKFATHAIIHQQWNKDFIRQELQALDSFQIKETATGLWLSRKQADKLESVLDQMEAKGAITVPSWSESLSGVGAPADMVETFRHLDVMEVWDIQFSHTIWDNQLNRLVAGSSCYDDAEEELGTVPDLPSFESAPESVIVKMGGAPIGKIQEGAKYWEFTPNGQESPTLKAHGLGGLQHQLKRWFGSTVEFA